MLTRTSFDVQAVAYAKASQAQPPPVKRKRLLLLSALPAAQRPCSGMDSATHEAACAAAEASICAPIAQLDVAALADSKAPCVAADPPHVKQSQRHLRPPFLQQAPALLSVAASADASASIGNGSQPAPLTALTQPKHLLRDLATAGPTPPSVGVDTKQREHEASTRSHAKTEEPSPRTAQMPSAVEQADTYAIPVTTRIRLGAKASVTEPDGVPSEPPPAVRASQTDADPARPASAAGASVQADDEHALILTLTSLQRWRASGPSRSTWSPLRHRSKHWHRQTFIHRLSHADNRRGHRRGHHAAGCMLCYPAARRLLLRLNRVSSPQTCRWSRQQLLPARRSHSCSHAGKTRTIDPVRLAMLQCNCRRASHSRRSRQRMRRLSNSPQQGLKHCRCRRCPGCRL